MSCSIEIYVRIIYFLCGDVIAESYRCEGYETEVDGLKVGPFFQRSVDASCKECYDAGCDCEAEHDPVDAWLPVFEVLVLVVQDVGEGGSGYFGDAPAAEDC